MGYEEVALCAICQDGEWEDDDQAVFCDQCNMPVHQSCYGSGANRILMGHGIATHVVLMPQRQAATGGILCPIKSGALKRTSDFRWAHIVCGLWIPSPNLGAPTAERRPARPFRLHALS